MRGAPALTDEEFRDAVQDALDSLPPEIASKLNNVAVIVEDRHPSGRLLGLFDPRGGLQRIIIYREHHTSRGERQADGAPRGRPLLRRR